MFEQPKIAPPETPYIDIRITKVNYYPLATLRARLLELMLPGNAGATAATEATASETAVWQTVAHNVATESMVELEHGVMAQEAMAQNMTQNMVATLAAPPAAITQTAMVQPNIDHAAMAQLAMDKGTTEQTCASQNGGQKRKFEDEHHDQPSQRWPPSVYLTPVNQIY